MNIFIPHRKDFNIYYEEIMKFSSSNYIFGEIHDYLPSYEIVNIQFPEAIFNWEQPNNGQLNYLEDKLIDWKKKSKIVLILNDLKSHYDVENKFADLYRLIQKYTDGVVHLGNFSLNNYKNKFSNKCEHRLIHHPLYVSLLDVEVDDFEKKFNVDFKGKYIVSVIGNIRSMEEVKLLLKIFRKIPVENKLLIIPKMFNFADIRNFRPYKLRGIYKYIYEKIIFFPLKKEQYLFGYKYIEYDLMVDLVKKTSLMIIPRLKNLNSGNLYLGLTFNKAMAIPKGGNQTEVAEYFNFPLLDLEKKNYKKILKKISDKKINEIFTTEEYLNKKEEFHPRKIAKDYETFFNDLIDS